jgi:uncharacterized repeat protein (TIGR03803 family)
MKNKLIGIAILLLVCLGIQLKAQFTKLYDFNSSVGGSNPESAFVGDGTFLYGTTYYGGIHNYGTIYKIKSDGSGFLKILDFDRFTKGSDPSLTPFYDGNFLYVAAGGGGVNDQGTLIKIKPDGTGFIKLMDFGSAGSITPLVSNGTFLYGTGGGGIYGNGTICKILPDGSGYAKLYDFGNAPDGAVPMPSLIYDGTFLYGITSGGGSAGNGTVFKIKPDGTGYMKIFDFVNAISGSEPRSLIFDGITLYGMTSGGGSGVCTISCGTIFKIMPNGSGYMKLLEFTGYPTDGNYPLGYLHFDGTFLYGMTSRGGSSDYGTIFKIKPDGSSYIKLLDFVGTANGTSPLGSFFFDGTFLYGTTFGGGTYNLGTIFKLAGAVGIEQYSKNTTDVNIYPNPANEIIYIDHKMNNAEIKIINVIGAELINCKVIVTGENTQIDVRGLQDGIYFINMKTIEGSTTKKIIINR